MGIIKHYITLSKVRILIMQLVTFALGYMLAFEGECYPVDFVWGLIGTAFSAAGAGALNHVFEVDIDKKMKRTKNRPLPLQQISILHATLFGIVMILIGLMLLFLCVNALTGILSFLTVILYLCVYTPLKKHSWFNTLVGAVPGAIPPLGGWAAATGELSTGAYIWFAILFVWQLPHFYAIAWMYKEDYIEGGLKMLSTIDPDGTRTARQISIQTGILLIISLFPYIFQQLSWIYVVGAILVWAWFMKSALKFHTNRSIENARKVLRLSIIYLPILLIIVMIDRMFT